MFVRNVTARIQCLVSEVCVRLDTPHPFFIVFRIDVFQVCLRPVKDSIRQFAKVGFSVAIKTILNPFWSLIINQYQPSLTRV